VIARLLFRFFTGRYSRKAGIGIGVGGAVLIAGVGYVAGPAVGRIITASPLVLPLQFTTGDLTVLWGVHGTVITLSLVGLSFAWNSIKNLPTTDTIIGEVAYRLRSIETITFLLTANLCIGAGVLLALVLNAVIGALGASWLPTFSARAALGLAMGAVLGDMAASFVKRRTGRERGAPFPGVDQLDFLVGALVVVLVLDPGWALSTFTPAGVVFLLVATPLVHLGANRVAYWTGLKDEPW